jgi:hypothetical protein
VKDRLAPVATVHHMINRAGILDPQLPGHFSRSTPKASLCQ